MAIEESGVSLRGVQGRLRLRAELRQPHRLYLAAKDPDYQASPCPVLAPLPLP
jgi:hypothetical protein